MSIIHILEKLISSFLPYICILCHSRTHIKRILCHRCYQELPILTHACTQCARELTLHSTCNECTISPPPFDKTYALFSYQGFVTQLIMNLKFQASLMNAKLLGELLADKIQQQWYVELPLPDILIPMPLHPKRMKKRGFNQAIEISKFIVKKCKIPLDIHSCQRIKYTLPQATLNAEERKNNIQNAFSVKKDFTDKHIAILDDVITTGETISALSRALKKAGARRIDVWCCARAIIKHKLPLGL